MPSEETLDSTLSVVVEVPHTAASNESSHSESPTTTSGPQGMVIMTTEAHTPSFIAARFEEGYVLSVLCTTQIY